jgi:hypothetical protein
MNWPGYNILIIIVISIVLLYLSLVYASRVSKVYTLVFQNGRLQIKEGLWVRKRFPFNFPFNAITGADANSLVKYYGEEKKVPFTS